MKTLTIWVCLLSFAVANTAFADDGVNINWQDAEEQQFSLQQYRGKPVLLHFWAAWCGPCRTELPHLVAWDKQQDLIQVVYLSLDQRIGQAAYFLEQKGLAITPLLADQDEARSLGIRGLPATLLIDAQGNIIRRMAGEQNWQNNSMNSLLATSIKK